MIVSAPVTAQTASSQPDEPTNRAISAETIKTPEPIIEPATSIVESSKPSSRRNLPLFAARDCNMALGLNWWISRRVNHH